MGEPRHRRVKPGEPVRRGTPLREGSALSRIEEARRRRERVAEPIPERPAEFAVDVQPSPPVGEGGPRRWPYFGLAILAGGAIAALVVLTMPGSSDLAESAPSEEPQPPLPTAPEIAIALSPPPETGEPVSSAPWQSADLPPVRRTAPATLTTAAIDDAPVAAVTVYTSTDDPRLTATLRPEPRRPIPWAVSSRVRPAPRPFPL